MKLFNDQADLIVCLAKKIANGVRKLVAQLATGGGKTVIFSAIASRFIEKSGKEVLICVHRTELLLQTRKTLHRHYGINPQLIVKGMKYIPPAPVYVGMVESVNKRIHLLSKNIGMLIVDEAHIASFHKLHEHFPDIPVIGFTATPLTANKKKPMNLFYEDIVCGVDIPELIRLGRLCQNMTWAPKDIVDRAELAVKGNEFEDDLMAQAFSKPHFVENTVKAYQKWCLGKKGMIFNVNVAHSKLVNQAFVDAGYNSRHIDCDSATDEERKEIFKWLKETPDAILHNVGIATVGFDEPTLEFIIVNKATMSMPLWLQMCGRGSRVLEWKNLFTIIDMGGNAITHGDWSQGRDWENIFFNPPKPGDGVAPVKNCPQCDAIIPASANVCQYCGFIFPPKEIAPEEQLDDFVMVTKGIDVSDLIEKHKLKREYYPFFKIGEDLATGAASTILKMSDENANFILQKYHELARKWTKEATAIRTANNGTKIIYNKWHQTKAQEHLFTELKKHFPEWEISKTESVSTPE